MAFGNLFTEQRPFNDAWGLMPGGAISEQPRNWNPSSGRFEPDRKGDPIRTMEIRYDRDQPSRAITLPYIPGQDDAAVDLKSFFPGDVEITPAWANAKNKAQKWQEFSSASRDYSQSGTDIPSYSAGSGGAFAAGSDFPGQGFGYQYQSPAIAQGIPVGQDPIFRKGPLSQEDFSEMVNYGLDLKKYGPSFGATPKSAPAGPKLPIFKPV